MINKKELIDFIDKYSLGGIFESKNSTRVKWIVDDENHTIFMGASSENSNIDVEVVLKNNYGIQSLTMGLQSTLAVKRMLSVLNDNIESITPKLRGDFVRCLIFDDGV